MLRGDDNAVNTFRFVSFGILHGDLRFGVGAQVGHLLALLADGGQFLHETVRQLDRQRHEVVHFIAGVAEHHALVAGALVFQCSPFHPLVDVGGLAVDGGYHATGFVVELVVAFVVTDILDDTAHYVIDGNVSFGLHFAGANNKAGGDQRLTGHF